MKQDLRANAINQQYQGKSVTNLLSEFLQTPALWDINDPRYDWLDDKTRKYLDENFDFDFGDILNCEKHWLEPYAIAAKLMTTQDELDKYCQILWRKPWGAIHASLSASARTSAVDAIFLPWAQDGNSAAINIMKEVIKPAGANEEKKEMTIRLVNDIEED